MTEHTKVYTYGGRVTHLLQPSDSANSYALALCRFSPNWPWMWQGTGSQDEIEEAERRPVCKACAKAIEPSTGDLLANLQASVDAARARRSE